MSKTNISIILKNSGQSFDSTRLTITSAVSVIKAIREASCVSPDIKWVNDIYLDGRKIGGILCEAVSDASGRISGYIAGIGINCFDSDFPEDIKAKAGAINDPLLSRNRLASLIRSHLLTDIMLPAEEITEAYRSHSFLIGRDISYNDNGLTVMARVLDIGDDGRLHVARDDGTEELLDSGEISVIPNSKDNT